MDFTLPEHLPPLLAEMDAFIDAEIVVPAAEKARRAAQVDAQTQAFRGRRRRRWLTIAGSLVAAIAIVAVIVVIASNWLSSQWYVAVNGSAGTGLRFGSSLRNENRDSACGTSAMRCSKVRVIRKTLRECV